MAKFLENESWRRKPASTANKEEYDPGESGQGSNHQYLLSEHSSLHSQDRGVGSLVFAFRASDMFSWIFRLLLLNASLSVALIIGGAALPAQAQQADGMALGDACTSCHGVDGQSQGSVPPIGGVDKATLLNALMAFKADKGDPTIMNRIVRGYTDAELAALADYFSSVKPK